MTEAKLIETLDNKYCNGDDFVYVLTHRETGVSKIGTGHPLNRAVAIAALNANPWQIHMTRIFFVESLPEYGFVSKRKGRTLEYRLHLLFDNRRSHGEWFKGAVEDVDKVVQRYRDEGAVIHSFAPMICLGDVLALGPRSRLKSTLFVKDKAEA